MVNQIYPPKLQLNTTKTSDNEAPFLDLHLFISGSFCFFFKNREEIVMTDFDLVNFPFLMATFHIVLPTEFISLGL